MPWGRGILGALASFIVIGGIIAIAAFMNGLAPATLPAAPGLNADDRAALAAPFDEIRRGELDALIARLDNVEDAEQARAQIAEVRALLPSFDPPRGRLMHWTASFNGEARMLRGVQEHLYPDHVAQSETILARASADAPWRVAGFHINVVPNADVRSPLAALSEGQPVVVAAVVLAVFFALFSLAMFLRALFLEGLKRRWLWLIFIAVGFAAFSVNASTGAWEISPIYVLLFSASAIWSGSMLDAWIVTFAIPVGAIVFLFRHGFKKTAVALDPG